MLIRENVNPVDRWQVLARIEPKALGGDHTERQWEEGVKCQDRHVSYLKQALAETFDGEMDSDLLAQVRQCVAKDCEVTGREWTVRELSAATGRHETILWVCGTRYEQGCAPRELRPPLLV